MTPRLDRNELQTKFGVRIKTLRAAKGMTQFSLAAKAGYSVPTISNLERGLSWPSLVTVFVLAEVLDVHPKILLFGEE